MAVCRNRDVDVDRESVEEILTGGRHLSALIS